VVRGATGLTVFPESYGGPYVFVLMD